MSTQLIRPSHAQQLEIRCNAGDAIVANLAVHVVFFFQRRLDTGALACAFARALSKLPIFAGRMAADGRRMRIRCEGQGVPFTTVSSDRTLCDAVRSTSQDSGLWLVDPINGATARWGLGPVCKVRVTHLADDATAIGLSWHHAVGDMSTLMVLMNGWVAAAAAEQLAEPLIVEDRAAYLDAHLPADGASVPGLRFLSISEFARSAMYLAKDAAKQRTLSVYFGEDEIARMRDSYGHRRWLSANDVVCAHVCEALMNADPAVDRRTLAIAVNTRKRCGLHPMLVGNIITTLNTDLRRAEAPSSTAERIRQNVDRFAAEHCDMRINQRVLDAAGAWRAARCVSTAFNPARWNPFVTNLSGFGVYRLQFEGAFTRYCTLLLKTPVAGLGALVEGADGRGLVFQISLPPKEFEVAASASAREHLHRFRSADDNIPSLHRRVHA